MRFSGSAAMREMDRIAIEELGIPGETLMLRAAAGVAETAKQMLTPEHNRVLALCGSGNNGGDGIGAAALLFVNGTTFIDWKSYAIFLVCFLATWFKVDSILMICLSAVAGILLYV